MNLSKSAEGYRSFHKDISGAIVIGAATGDTVLVTARNANSTIFIQRIIAYITTDAAQSWAFEDTATTPVVVANVTISPGAGTRWDFDFGAVGLPLTEGKNLNLNVSAAGLAGNILWEGYTKLTSAVAAGPTN